MMPMCKINCSGGCPDCAPDDHWPTAQDAVYYLWTMNWYISPDETIHNPRYISDKERAAALWLCSKYGYEWG